MQAWTVSSLHAALMACLEVPGAARGRQRQVSPRKAVTKAKEIQPVVAKDIMMSVVLVLPQKGNKELLPPSLGEIIPFPDSACASACCRPPLLLQAQPCCRGGAGGQKLKGGRISQSSGLQDIIRTFHACPPKKKPFAHHLLHLYHPSRNS